MSACQYGLFVFHLSLSRAQPNTPGRRFQKQLRGVWVVYHEAFALQTLHRFSAEQLIEVAALSNLDEGPIGFTGESTSAVKAAEFQAHMQAQLATKSFSNADNRNIAVGIIKATPQSINWLTQSETRI